MLKDVQSAKWGVEFSVHKFRASDIEDAKRAGLHVATMGDFLDAGIDPYAITEGQENLLVNNGINLLLTLLIGGGGTAYNNAASRLGVGDGNGSVPTAAATDSGLTATTNKYFQVADATYPSVSSTTATWKATFPTGQANYAWNEWIIDNNGSAGSGTAAGGTALNHKGVSLGSKTSAASWAFTVTVTIS